MADHPDLGIPGLVDAALVDAALVAAALVAAALVAAALVDAGPCRAIRASSWCKAAAPRPAESGPANWSAGRSTTAIKNPTITAVRDSARIPSRSTRRSPAPQDARFGPAGQTCTNWRLAHDMVGPGPRRLIRGARMVAPPRSC